MSAERWEYSVATRSPCRKPLGSKPVGCHKWELFIDRWAGISASQRTEIVRHIAELLDHLGIAKIPGGRVARAAKRDRADMAFFARKRLSAHYKRPPG